MKDSEHREPFHIPSLDGIRAVSIALVFVAHAGLAHVVPGGLGVTIFFFLSGYLISSLMRREFARSGTLHIRNFYVRRAVRILPPFYTALALAVLLTICGLLPGRASVEGVAMLALHVGNYLQIFWRQYAIPHGSGVYWSLAVEEHFYLTFPFVALWLLRSRSTRRALVTLVGLACLVLCWRLVLVSGGASEERTYYASDTRVDSILWGTVLAFWKNPIFEGRSGPSRPGLRLALLFGAGSVLLCTLILRQPFFRETYRYSLQGIALLPLFYYSVKDATWWPFRILNSRVLVYIGALSYTFYLVHHVVLHVVDATVPAAPALLRALVSAAIGLGFAALSHRYMEQPLARRRRRYQG